ncbi:MAG: hypothetical protein M0R30_13950 [Methanoregula sp.]|uniref:hypothetical protein n=1 Tax=Methanoregula sp. TaxID=2052170 RepID=UPI0025F33244|nr:hypothetical protein [Methanoregula sp.]MCK9632730.1 hypothetical protein [Methanoregula sp.]
MRGEKLSDAIVYDKLHLLKKDFDGYIERNTIKVDANLPVFFGYVISALENSFPHLPDDTYDEFIDGITFKVLDASANVGDFEYVKKVMANAIRFKKKKDAETGVNIVIGLKLLKVGDHVHALDFLKKYATLDVKLGTSVAYCYYVLSLREFKKDESSKKYRPGEMELFAREMMHALAQTKPPINSIKQLEVEDTEFLEKIFWQMIFTGLEWFPDERWFVEAGLQNVAFTHDGEMRKRLLDLGSQRFYNDIHFLREMYYYKLETRDAPGAAGVVNQLLKQYPDDLEPIYLGLKLSLLTSKKMTYHGFHKLAVTKGMPAQVIELFDFTFDLMNRDYKEAMARIAEFETEFPQFQYYAIALKYIAADLISPDENRMKKARKTLLDSLDQYCTVELINKK